MSDWKSKLPTFEEVVSIATKLGKDIKNSVTEIVQDYKEKHPSVDESATKNSTPPAEKKTVKKTSEKE